jgi:hypothetical protein
MGYSSLLASGIEVTLPAPKRQIFMAFADAVSAIAGCADATAAAQI